MFLRLTSLPPPRSWRHLVPNLMTCLALAAGMTAMRLALLGDWRESISFIVAAAGLDALDGPAARLLRVDSRFGAQLDSLSDLVCFGIAPACLAWRWALTDSGIWGWACALIFGVAAALRLARFNSAGERNAASTKTRDFVGVPTPAGAGLAMMPLFASFGLGIATAGQSVAIGIWLIVVALLMVSRLRTVSLAGAARRYGAMSWLVLAALAVGGFIAPWSVLFTLGCFYMLTLAVRPAP